MIANFDYYNRFEQPVISLRSPNDEFMGYIDNVKNLNINPEFNSVSEMSCDIYKYSDNGVILPIYDDIKVKRQLYVENIGFFIITEVVENNDSDGIYKSLTLYSCEHEISYKKLTYFNGVYKFWNTVNPSESLMGMILDSLPRWSIGHVDDTVADLYRTFEEPDNTIYSFLMDEVEAAYECLFDFDIMNRVINVYDKNNYIKRTTILLSRKDVIDNIKITEKSEEIYTALTLYGDDEITYSSINPLGTSTVYNFNYYKPWMSDGLVQSLETWENNIKNAENNISAYRSSLVTKVGEFQIIQSDIDAYNKQIVLLEKQLGVNTLDTATVANLNKQIAGIKVSLAKKLNEYEIKRDEISLINQNLDDIHISCSFSNNFTEDEIKELDSYIYEASEVDDTLSFTENMTYSEQEAILMQLYSKAKNMLSDISIPSEELSLDTKNFIFQKDFLPYTKQLETGVIIDIETEDDIIISYVLLKMDVNYQDKTINLTLGNKYRTSNAEKLWSDWESNISKASSTLSYERSKYGKAVNSGSLDRMNAFMNSSLDLTLNQVKASDGQSFEITDSGIRARRINPETNEIDDNQLWMTANNIVFSTDNWQTIKTAIGRLLLPDGTEGYGINAEYLIGKMIVGNGMEISNEGGSFKIDETGITIKQYDEKIRELEGSQLINSVTISSSGQFFNYTEDRYSPDTIILTPTFKNCEYSRWQYSTDGTVWNDVITNKNEETDEIAVSSISGIEITNTGTLIIFNDCSLFDINSSITFKIITQYENEDISQDSITIIKLNKNISVNSIIQQYYVSTSSLETIDGEWIETQPFFEREKFLWVRNKLIYADDTFAYTTEYCDNTWSTINNQTLMLEDSIKNLENDTISKFNEFEKYIRFENGRILLGEAGNELELVISNDKIQFLQNASEVAYFSNQKLFVTNGEYTNSLRLGNFAFIPRENKNLSFKKVTD